MPYTPATSHLWLLLYIPPSTKLTVARVDSLLQADKSLGQKLASRLNVRPTMWRWREFEDAGELFEERMLCLKLWSLFLVDNCVLLCNEIKTSFLWCHNPMAYCDINKWGHIVTAVFCDSYLYSHVLISRNYFYIIESSLDNACSSSSECSKNYVWACLIIYISLLNKSIVHDFLVWEDNIPQNNQVLSILKF